MQLDRSHHTNGILHHCQATPNFQAEYGITRYIAMARDLKQDIIMP